MRTALRSASVLALSAAALATRAQVALADGQTVSLPNQAFARTVVTSTSTSFVSRDASGVPVFSGTLDSYVLTGGGLGGYSFGYVLTNDAVSPRAMQGLSIPGFSGSLTAVLQSSLGAQGGYGRLATTASRAGGVLTFAFPGGSGLLAPGMGSAAFLVDTDAASYARSSATVLGGLGGVAICTAANPTPEPSALAALGLGALALLRRRKIRS